MNRILRGVVVLAASGLAWGCNTEPDELGGGDPTTIVASPAVLFIARGDSQAVLLRLQDQQGTSLESPITLTGIVAPIAVSVDSLFRPIFSPDGSLTANTRGTELRIFVRGDALGATTFTVSAGGLTKIIPVTVTPTGITPTVSNAAPLIGELVTITAEPGLTFISTSRIVGPTGALAAYTVAVAADGSTMTVQFLPGFTGAYSITDVVPSYAPSLKITLASATAITLGTTVAPGLPGVNSIATAPALLPATHSDTVGIIDNGTSYPAVVAEGDGGRLYKLIVAEAGDYAIVLAWPGGKDLGVFIYDESGTAVLASDDSGGLNDASETAHATLAVGTYYIGAVYFNYGANPLPAYINISVIPD